MKLPKLKHWYHATTIERAQQIVQDGCLKAAWIDGIYMTNKQNYSETFVKMRGHSEWAVIKIPSSRLDRTQLHISTDHAFEVPKDFVSVRYIGGPIPVVAEDISCWESDKT
jgi:hypothetical protein